MPNPHYSVYRKMYALKSPITPPDARPAGPSAGGSRQPWKMPRTPGPGRRVHKVLGRRVRTLAREDF